MLVTPEIAEGADVLSIPRQGPPKEMLSVSVLKDGRTKVRMNASSLQIIQECMRKAQYSLDEGWIAKEENPATVFGSAVHSFMEVFYSGKFDARIMPQMKEFEMMAAGLTLDNESDDLCLRAFRAFLTKHQPISSLPETDKRSAQNGAWILHNYLTNFISDPYVAYVDKDGPFIERTLSAVIFEDKSLVVEVFGTIDFVFRHIESDLIICGDHKTASSLGFKESSYFDREKPNHQYTGYLLLLRKVCGLDVSDFMVNVVEVKAKPKTARGSAPSFPRQVTSRNADDFNEFRELVVYYAVRYLEAQKSGLWPLGPVLACASYGACQYRQVCASPKSMRETILGNKFSKKGDINET